VIRALALMLLVALPVRAETIVAGLSQNIVSITTDFSGSELLIYGAVKRDAPIPAGKPLEVIITVQGPSRALTVRRKERRFGIWMNTESVEIGQAPSFYAIAASAPLQESLSETENLRQKITIPKAIYSIGIAEDAADAPNFLDALIRLRTEDGSFSMDERSVGIQQSTLFRTNIALPANLTEGDYKVRFFLTRGGAVIDSQEKTVLVYKEGLERWLYALAHKQPLLYGLLALVLAVAAGWGASAIFTMLRR
tara:strand:+ start:6618 stop:7373 length:756 start_codon:yes stop_codon:yes gene_type:complete